MNAIPTAPDPTQRFSNRVEYYIRYRPSYPPAAIECLAREFGLTPTHIVADVGSGTGILTERLLRHGNPVYAVEPNAEMRAAAERLLRGYPAFHSVAGTAEHTTLPRASVDWITAAQAFHWFDADAARVEFARILRRGLTAARDGGRVALLWNNRREDAPFLHDYERFLHEFAADYAAVKHQNVESDGRLEQLFGSGGYARRTFENRQDFDFEGLKGRMLSSSYMPAAGHPRHAAMLTALRQLFDRHAILNRVRVEYDTQVYVGRLAEEEAA